MQSTLANPSLVVRLSLPINASKSQEHKFEARLQKLTKAQVYVVKDRVLPGEKYAVLCTSSKLTPEEIISSRMLFTLKSDLDPKDRLNILNKLKEAVYKKDFGDFRDYKYIDFHKFLSKNT